MLFSGIGLTEHSLFSPWKLFLEAFIQKKSNSELGICLNVMSKRPRKIAANQCHLSRSSASPFLVTPGMVWPAKECCTLYYLQLSKVFIHQRPPKCQHCWDRGLLTLLSNGYHSCSQIAEMFQTAWEEDEVKLRQIWERKTMTPRDCYKTEMIDWKIPLRSSGSVSKPKEGTKGNSCKS